METVKVILRHLATEDEDAFVNGIRDKSLRSAYGFPPDMNDRTASQIFQRFCGMNSAFAMLTALSLTSAALSRSYILSFVSPSATDIRAGLPEKGQTLAFAVFPLWQRQGYMEEALRRYIDQLFHDTGTAYIHCGHFAENLPSRSLLQKLRFHDYSQHRIGSRIIIDEILFR